MLERLRTMLAGDLAVDLGTANTLIYQCRRGVVVDEPSVVAVSRAQTKPNMLAVGRDAHRMLGKTPGEISAIRPIRDSVIADFTMAQAMLKQLVSRVPRRQRFIRPRMVVSVPVGITNVERRAVRDAVDQVGVRSVSFIGQSLAAAIGAGLEVHAPRGNMVVDIGSGSTDVAVVSMSGMVVNVNIKVAGDQLDEAIVNHLRRRHNMLIGERTAEQVKIQIGSAYASDEGVDPAPMPVKGRDLVSGMPKTVSISAGEIREALRETTRHFVTAVKAALEKTPPELAGDIAERGIHLTGGGALLRGLDTLLAREIGIPVEVVEDPLRSVVRGAGVAVDDTGRFRDLLSND